MGKIIVFHSFFGGVGKSTIIKNISGILAEENKKTVVIDCDLYSPVMHGLYEIPKDRIKYTLNDFLNGDCKLNDTIYEVEKNKKYLLPATLEGGGILKILREGVDLEKLASLFDDVKKNLKAD